MPFSEKISLKVQMGQLKKTQLILFTCTLLAPLQNTTAAGHRLHCSFHLGQDCVSRTNTPEIT